MTILGGRKSQEFKTKVFNNIKNKDNLLQRM